MFGLLPKRAFVHRMSAYTSSTSSLQMPIRKRMASVRPPAGHYALYDAVDGLGAQAHVEQQDDEQRRSRHAGDDQYRSLYVRCAFREMRVRINDLLPATRESLSL